MLFGRALVKVLESGQGWLDVVKIAKRIAKVTKVCIEQQGQFGVFIWKDGFETTTLKMGKKQIIWHHQNHIKADEDNLAAVFVLF